MSKVLKTVPGWSPSGVQVSPSNHRKSENFKNLKRSKWKPKKLEKLHLWDYIKLNACMHEMHANVHEMCARIHRSIQFFNTKIHQKKPGMMSAVKELQFMGDGGAVGMHSVLWEQRQEETVPAFISPLLLGSVLSPSLCHPLIQKEGSSGWIGRGVMFERLNFPASDSHS